MDFKIISVVTDFPGKVRRVRALAQDIKSGRRFNYNVSECDPDNLLSICKSITDQLDDKSSTVKADSYVAETHRLFSTHTKHKPKKIKDEIK